MEVGESRRGVLELTEGPPDQVAHRQLALLHFGAEPRFLGIGHAGPDVVDEVALCLALWFEHQGCRLVYQSV